MISNINNSSIRPFNNKNEIEVSKNVDVKSSKENTNNTDKVKDLKQSIANGTYKVDIDKLSEKMADELM